MDGPWSIYNERVNRREKGNFSKSIRRQIGWFRQCNYLAKCIIVFCALVLTVIIHTDAQSTNSHSNSSSNSDVSGSNRYSSSRLSSAQVATPTDTGCKRVHLNTSDESEFVCECNAHHCDTLKFEWPAEINKFLCVVTSKSGSRFRQYTVNGAQPDEPRKDNTGDHEAGADHDDTIDRLVVVHTDRRSQQVVGFGGAFTDSASMLVMDKLSEPTRQHWLQAYFGASGLDYNLGRITIGGTDMSERAYTCDDTDNNADDLDLSKFELQREDLAYKIPLVRRVNALRQHRSLDKPIKLLATSWSPPAWMKANEDLVRGRLKGNSSGPYYDAYARYIVRWMDEYEQRGVPIWSMTPQNEPHTPARIPQVIDFNSNPFEPEAMADFVEHNLLPQLIKSKRFAAGEDTFELLLWDDTLDGFEKFREALMSRQLIRDYGRGFALHWYSQAVDRVPYSALHALHRRLHQQAVHRASSTSAAKPMAMYSTEASIIAPPKPGDWSRAAKYARDIIENLRAGTLAWIDWNLSLDLSGGPTWSGNYLDAAVLIDPQKGVFYKQPVYYVLGQVSRFVRAGSHVLPTDVYEPAADAADDGANDDRWHLVSAAGHTGGTGKQNNTTGSGLGELLAVAAELRPEAEAAPGRKAASRKLAVVLFNRASREMRVRLDLLECGGGSPAAGNSANSRGNSNNDVVGTVTLEPHSVTSVAFACN